MCGVISKPAPQGICPYGCERAKVEYLYESVSNLLCTKATLTQCFTHDPARDI